jgi:uncharacterized membrane protein required for colicin V production
MSPLEAEDGLDMVDFLKSAPIVDIVILLGFFAALILGVMQGAIRRILGIVAIVFAFLVAANLRNPLGDYLAQNWHQFDLGYNRLIAFTITFVVGAVASSIVIQGFYKRADLYAKHPIVDDALGGLLGLTQGMLLLVMAVIILNSSVLPPVQNGDVTPLRYAQDLIVNQSHVAGAIRDVVAPPFVHILSFLLPSDLVSLFP